MKKQKLFLLSLILFAGAFHLLSMQKGHHWGGDFAGYIEQARALGEGKEALEEYDERAVFRVKESTRLHIGPVYYPWGTSILLLPIIKAFGLNIEVLKAFIFLLFLPGLWAIYLLFRKRFGSWDSLWIVGLMAFLPYLWQLKHSVASNLPFFTTAFFTLFVYQRVLVQRKFWVNETVSMVIVGLATFFPVLFRAQGQAFLPVLFLTQVVSLYLQEGSWTKKLSWKAGLPYAVFGLLFLLEKLILPQSSYYSLLSPPGPRDLVLGLYYYAHLPGEIFDVPFLRNFGELIFGSTLVFVMVSWVMRMKEDYHYIIFFLVNLLVLIAIPWRQGLKYILPLIPFYFYWTFTGMQYLLSPIGNMAGKLAIGKITLEPKDLPWKMFAMTIGMFFLLHSGLEAYHNIRTEEVIEGPYTKEGREMLDFVAQNTLADELIVATRPRVIVLFCDRKAFRYENPLDEFPKGIGDLLVLEKPDPTDPCPYADEGKKEQLKLVFENALFEIFRKKDS